MPAGTWPDGVERIGRTANSRHQPEVFLKRRLDLLARTVVAIVWRVPAVDRTVAAIDRRNGLNVTEQVLPAAGLQDNRHGKRGRCLQPGFDRRVLNVLDEWAGEVAPAGQHQEDLRGIDTALDFRVPVLASMDLRVGPETHTQHLLSGRQILAKFTEPPDVVVGIGDEAGKRAAAVRRRRRLAGCSRVRPALRRRTLCWRKISGHVRMRATSRVDLPLSVQFAPIRHTPPARRGRIDVDQIVNGFRGRNQ